MLQVHNTTVSLKKKDWSLEKKLHIFKDVFDKYMIKNQVVDVKTYFWETVIHVYTLKKSSLI